MDNVFLWGAIDLLLGMDDPNRIQVVIVTGNDKTENIEKYGKENETPNLT